MLQAKARIFVAEDDSAILELLRIRLELAGYHSFYARDGFRARESISRTLPHAVILDIGLPRLDGFEVLQGIKSDARTKHIPVLMLSARHAESDVQKSLAYGAGDYITKPFDDRKLLQRVARLVAGSRDGNGPASVDETAQPPWS